MIRCTGPKEARTMDETLHSIKVKIGDSSFEAEGDKETIDLQYRSFLEAVMTVGGQPQGRSQSTEEDSGRGQSEAGPQTPGSQPDLDDEITESLLKRVFQDNGDYISLSAIPSTEQQQADSILLLLYGFAQLKGEPKVTGVTLMKACRQSGVQIDRVDRVITARDGYYLSGGTKRGKRYQLNNRGEKLVKKLISELE